MRVDDSGGAHLPRGVDGSFGVVKYTYVAPDGLGKVTGTIRAELDSELAREIEIPFHANVISHVRLVPEIAFVVVSDDQHGPTDGAVRKVNVEAPMAIRDVRVSQGGGEKAPSIRWQGSEGAKTGELLVAFGRTLTNAGGAGVLGLAVDYGDKTEDIPLPWRVVHVAGEKGVEKKR